MEDKFYIYAIIRDDGERFRFDHDELYLSSNNSFLVRPEVESSEVSYTDANGGEMTGQRLALPEQDIRGELFVKGSDYWDLYFRLASFFKINHHYSLIYRRANGELFAQKNAWISRNLQINPPAYETNSTFTVSFKMQTGILYEYREDAAGNEQYANRVNIPLISSSDGGEMWDSVGEMWDDVGAQWEAGDGGLRSVTNNSAGLIYPVWEVKGVAINPSIRNNTTDSTAQYNGTVSEGQTLVVDFAEGEARLNGALVTRNMSGELFTRPGLNQIGFDTNGGGAKYSYILWNNILGGD